MKSVVQRAILALALLAGGLTAPFFGPVRAAWADEVTAKVQKQYETLKDFQAEFVQELKNSATGETETRSGTISYKSPNLVRWETRSPEPETLVLGKDVVWNYIPGEKTAYKYKADDILSSRTMLRFLSGKANLEEEFIVAREGQEDAPSGSAGGAGVIRLRLTPRNPEANLTLAHMWVDSQTFLIKHIAIRDFYNNTNKLTLNDLAINAGLQPELFTFTPPSGVKVKDNTK